jgi:hypothetical protein
MSDHLPVRARRLSPVPLPRATARRLTALDQGEFLAKATIAAETRIARAEIESLVDVTESAMFGAGAIASVQGCLIGGTPWAARPVALIAETGYSGLRQIVHRHAQGDR